MERDIRHRRLAPDVAAVADPFTGVRIVFNRQDAVGAGTSQAAPIWAALTVLMNQYLLGARRTPAGQHQPAAVSGCRGCEPARRSATSPLAGTPSTLSQPGYDVVTGLGSPNVDFLVRDLLDIQNGAAPR